MEWISVKERLPEDDKWVLVTDGLGIGLAQYNLDQDDFFGYNERKVRGYITHWMPLPKPPKE
jgi:hypothetical protein